MKTLLDVRGYDRFMHSRDAVLEVMLRKYLRAMDRALDQIKEMILGHVAFELMRSQVSVMDLRRKTHALSDFIDHITPSFQTELTRLVMRMRRVSFCLSYLGAANAASTAMNKDAHKLTRDAIDASMEADMYAGGKVHHRVFHALEELKTDLVKAYRMGLLLEESPEEILQRIDHAFPKRRRFKVPRKALRHPDLKESEQPKPKDGFAFGIIDEDDWSDITKDYLAEEVPFFPNRQPQDEESYYEKTGQYEWELEQETTHDFVERVRNGEIDSANQAGITDFVWIAIIDSKTCDYCCLPRNGMTSTEIEEALQSGDLDEDECDALTPPGHFKCRCRPAPATADLPEKTEVDFSDLDAYLDMKAAGG